MQGDIQFVQFDAYNMIKCMYSYEPREIPREWEVEKFSRSFTARTQQGKRSHFTPLPPTSVNAYSSLSLGADFSGLGRHTKQTTQEIHKPIGRTQGCWTTNKEKSLMLTTVSINDITATEST